MFVSEDGRPASGVSAAWDEGEGDDGATLPHSPVIYHYRLLKFLAVFGVGTEKEAESDDGGGGGRLEAHLVPDKEKEVRGCWFYFTRFVGGMWATREMSAAKDREVYVRTTIRELVIYCIFLCTLCISEGWGEGRGAESRKIGRLSLHFSLRAVTFGMTSATQYYYSNILQKLFKENQKVTTVEEFWEFMEGEFLDSLYWEYNYNSGEASNFICPGGDSSIGPCPVAPADRNILYENRLLGVPRLRQLRVRNGSCELHEEVQRMTRTCFAEYSTSAEDVEPFNINTTIKQLMHTSKSA